MTPLRAAPRSCISPFLKTFLLCDFGIIDIAWSVSEPPDLSEILKQGCRIALLFSESAEEPRSRARMLRWFMSGLVVFALWKLKRRVAAPGTWRTATRPGPSESVQHGPLGIACHVFPVGLGINERPRTGLFAACPAEHHLFQEPGGRCPRDAPELERRCLARISGVEVRLEVSHQTDGSHCRAMRLYAIAQWPGDVRPDGSTSARDARSALGRRPGAASRRPTGSADRRASNRYRFFGRNGLETTSAGPAGSPGGLGT